MNKISLCRSKVCDAILYLVKLRMKYKPALDWLRVIPIIHFLSGACVPFATVDHKTKKFNACENVYGCKDVKTNLKSGFVS